MLGKADDQQSLPRVDFAKFAWDINSGIPIPANANQPTGPPELFPITACNCITTGKAYSTKYAVVIVREFQAQFKVYWCIFS